MNSEPLIEQSASSQGLDSSVGPEGTEGVKDENTLGGIITISLVFVVLLGLVLISNKGNNVHIISTNLESVEADLKEINRLFAESYMVSRQNMHRFQAHEKSYRFGYAQLGNFVGSRKSRRETIAQEPLMSTLDPFSFKSILILDRFSALQKATKTYDFSLIENKDTHMVTLDSTEAALDNNPKKTEKVGYFYYGRVGSA